MFRLKFFVLKRKKELGKKSVSNLLLFTNLMLLPLTNITLLVLLVIKGLN